MMRKTAAALLVTALATTIFVFWVLVPADVAAQFNDSTATTDVKATGPGGTATGDIDMGGYRIHDSVDELNICAVAASTHALTTSDGICGGAFEVDGTLFADAGISCAGSVTITSGSAFRGGTEGAGYYPLVTQQTPDSGLLTTGPLSNGLIFSEVGDLAYDFAHAQQTNPTLWIQSANQSATEWLSLAHNQTDAVLATGAGDIYLDPASGEVNIDGAVLQTRQFLHDNFVWGGAIYAVFWDLTVVVGAGTNALKANDGEGGVAVLTTGGAGGPDSEGTWITNASFSRAINPHFRARVKLLTDLVDKEVRVGFSDTQVNDFTAAATDYAFIQYDESVDATDWFYVCSDAATPTATLGVGPVAGTKQMLNVRLLSTGAAEFSVDGTVVATIAGCVNADTVLYFGVSLQEEAALAEVLEIDYIQGAWD
jgi:hypothetical protein